MLGMSGAGKTTVGQEIAKARSFEFVDTDAQLIELTGRESIQHIIDEQGDDFLLAIQEPLLMGIDPEKKVVSPGGDIVHMSIALNHLRQKALTLFLDDSLENIESRMGDPSRRGIVGLQTKTLKQVYEERLPLYFEAADVVVDCRQKVMRQIVHESLERTSEALAA